MRLRGHLVGLALLIQATPCVPIEFASLSRELSRQTAIDARYSFLEPEIKRMFAPQLQMCAAQSSLWSEQFKLCDKQSQLCGKQSPLFGAQ